MLEVLKWTACCLMVGELRKPGTAVGLLAVVVFQLGDRVLLAVIATFVSMLVEPVFQELRGSRVVFGVLAVLPSPVVLTGMAGKLLVQLTRVEVLEL